MMVERANGHARALQSSEQAMGRPQEQQPQQPLQLHADVPQARSWPKSRRRKKPVADECSFLGPKTLIQTKRCWEEKKRGHQFSKSVERSSLGWRGSVAGPLQRTMSRSLGKDRRSKTSEH